MVRRRLRQHLRIFARVDFTFVVLSAVLLLLGCVFIYGAGQETGGRLATYWQRQLCWTALGGMCFLLTCRVGYELLGHWAWALYGLSVMMLILVKFFGVATHHARSWLLIPILGIRIQPAELAKPATVLLVAWLASRPSLNVRRGEFMLPVLLVVALPVVLICMQPDWGTALVFIPFTLAILFVGGIPWKWIAAGVLAVALLAPVGYRSLKPHQKARIRTFLGPAENVSDTGWNAHQSLLAVGSGGLWGKGFMNGTQHVLGFLPRAVAPTDFIFSVVAEELGFVGAGAVVCAFFVIVLCCLRTAALAQNKFGSYLAVGVAAILFTHVYINIGMTVRLAPIIGIPLPFVSYGGSFMVSTMICAGLVQSVHVRRKQPGSI